MALADRRDRTSVARPAPRQAPQQRQVTLDSGRFEPGLERRWEQAWNRARSTNR